MTSWFIDMTSNSEVNENICNHFEKIIQDFKASLIEAETIQRDPAFYLDDYFSEVKRQVDLRKETLNQEIAQYADECIQKIEKIYQDCLKLADSIMKAAENVTCKSELEELNRIKFDDGNAKELKNSVDSIIDKYKTSLLGYECHVFAAS